MARAISDADFVFNGVALEDELQSITATFSVPQAEITSFADTYQNVLAGKPAVALNMNGFWDPAASQGDATIFAALGGVALTWDFEPNGVLGYNGYATVESYSITSQVNAAITYTAAMRHNGGSAAADGLAPTRA